jgi:hypothetical protein
MAGLVLLLAAGSAVAHAGPAFEHMLRAAGLTVEAAPAESGELALAQLARGEPFPEAYVIAPAPDGTVVRVMPGAARALDPELARAWSAALPGRVAALEVAPNRDRHLVGLFDAGQTLELATCDAGRVSGADGPWPCDEAAVLARFAALTGVAEPHRLGIAGGRGLLATPGG